jgi:hypothetical protein
MDVKDATERLVGWLLQINYLGKRGGFVQLMAPPQVVEALPEGFTPIVERESSPGSLPARKSASHFASRALASRLHSSSR